jgi:ABC-2 type transport system permease protein
MAGDLRRLVRAYPALLRLGFQESIAYRAEFIVWMLSMTMPLVMLALMSAVSGDAPLGRFDSPTFTAYYLVTLIVRQMTGAWVMWEIVREIREGTLALRLLRPVHPLAAHSAESLAAIPLRAAFSLPITLLALYFAGRDHVSHDPVVIAAFVVSLVGAWVLNFSVSAIVGTLALYLESSISIWEIWLGGFMLFSGYLVPLELFPKWIEQIARLMPFAYLQALPVEMLTGLRSRADALHGLFWQWVYAASAVAVMLLFWRRATARFAAYGG